MNRWAGFGALAVGCVVLALVLFRPPDTGGRVRDDGPSPVPSAPAPGRAPAASPAPDPVTAAPAPDDEVDDPPPADGTELPPGLAEQRAWRSRPAATYAIRVLAPFSTIRHVLMKTGDPDARALADELGTGPMQDLREVRASDEEDPLTPLSPSLVKSAEAVAASPWASDPQIRTSLDRITKQLAEFEQAKAGVLVEEPPPTGEGEHGEVP